MSTLDLDAILRDSECADLPPIVEHGAGPGFTARLSAHIRTLVAALREAEQRARLTPEGREFIARVRTNPILSGPVYVTTLLAIIDRLAPEQEE